MKTIIALLTLAALPCMAQTVRFDIVTTRANGTVATNTLDLTEQRTQRLQDAIGTATVRKWLNQTITATIRADRLAREQAAYDEAQRVAQEALIQRKSAIEAEVE